MADMSILEKVNSPDDVKALPVEDLPELANDIRQSLIDHVTKTGGHLGPNLGVVELTIALHRVFDSPIDPIIFDTGHQSYVHKMLTGRKDDFGTLRQAGGLSGYPSRAESNHDWLENSHASVALSWAEGMAKAFKLRNEPRTVVVVVGDGALTGGVSWEALNNIAVEEDLRIVIVVNDNGRSYRPTVGGMAKKLAEVRTNPKYEPTLDAIKRGVSSTPVIGKKAYEILHGVKAGIKDTLMPDGIYTDFNIKYLGPIDGHNFSQLISVLESARDFNGTVMVHAITKKGSGYKVAESHQDDQFHAIGQIDSITGQPLKKSDKKSWTDTFSELILEEARQRPELVGITAAMMIPVGLNAFADEFPDRVFDVGIAEQQAVASAAGLARAGMHPVVAIYSTFLNRAFDQVLMDVALHKLGVTFVLDRAGITGQDGPSHNGMWDVSMLSMVPGLKLTSPRDGTRLKNALSEALDTSDRPTVIRYSKGDIPEDIPAVETVGGMDFLVKHESADILILGIGQLAGVAVETADLLKKSELGVRADVVDPGWVLPINDSLIELTKQYQLVVSIEDNLVIGGIGSQLSAMLRKENAKTWVREFGIPREFIAQGSRSQVLADCGLTAPAIQESVAETWKTLSNNTDNYPHN